MTTYTQTKAALDEIAARTEANRKRLEQAKILIGTADSDLGGMGSAYGAIVADIDANAAANPSDPAWIAAKAEKDLMVSDFQALKSRAAALKTAVIE